MNTDSIRQHKRTQRREIAPAVALENSRLVTEALLAEACFNNSQTMAIYLANDGEIDPLRLAESAWQQDKRVFLPVLNSGEKSLVFAPFRADTELVPNRFNIPEPVCKPEEHVMANQLDLLVMPLVAFDPQANRVGMGGGYYDRTLAFLKSGDRAVGERDGLAHAESAQTGSTHTRSTGTRSTGTGPVLVGIAHDCQKVDTLQAQSWDVPLDLVITESGRYTR